MPLLPFVHITDWSSSSSSLAMASKRRWSPCTWRYAIEDSQPDLPLKPRAANCSTLLAPRERERKLLPPPAALQAADNVTMTAWDQILARQCPGDRLVDTGGAHNKKQAQSDQKSDVDAMESWAARENISVRKKATGQKLGAKSLDERMRRKKKKADDLCKNRPWVDSSMRRKREMTPSELYFCEICAAKARGWPADDDDDCC